LSPSREVAALGAPRPAAAAAASTSTQRWGTTDVAQMLCRVSRSMRMATGALVPPPVPCPIRIIGRLAKRGGLSGRPISRNRPTSPALKVTDPREFAQEKAAFPEAFQTLAVGPHAATTPQHVFVGPMTPDEWGCLMYTHLDHHFTQFGV
jgi:hypothetical protein